MRTGLGFTSPGVNPLDGQPLQAGQALVTGPAFTGPRVSVVWLDRRIPWPRWISADAQGYPEDLGTTTGGTWSGGAQSLPPLTTTAMPSWVWLVALAVVAYLVFGKRASAGEWE